MSVPTWQPGTFYQPNALVVPLTAPPVLTSALENGNFEDGDDGWDKGTGWEIIMGSGFDGTWLAHYDEFATGESSLVNQNIAAVTPGQAITATGKLHAGGNTGPTGGAAIHLIWYDEDMDVITFDSTGVVTNSSDWITATVSGTAPALAAFATVAVAAYRNSGIKDIFADAISWDYVASNAPEGLIFKAVQADAGYSASTEPVWPTTLGVTVVDGGVTWEAVLTTRVTWEASPILISGSTEPTFPTAIGAVVADNTIGWEAISRRIEDSKCPNTAVVAIAASKVFAADDDIIAFCATIKPLDWSTRDDAGYLPFGLQTYGSQPVSAIGLYRGNLVAFNATGFQMWQVDQDPANMALLDSVPISCTYPRTVVPVGNDLNFLSAKGVRGLGIAAASTNLQANGVGEPIDSLIRAAIVAGTYDPFALYWPFTGQNWFIFGPEAFVLTINGANKKSWSRYTFPAAITDWTLDGDDLVLRAGNYIWRMDAELVQDDVASTAFTIGTGGAGQLTLVGSVAGNSPIFGKVHTSNNFVYFGSYNTGAVLQYSIGPTGALTALSPASVACGPHPLDIYITQSGDFMYVNCSDDRTYRFSIGLDGKLTPGSPAYYATGGNPHSMVSTPDESYLYVCQTGAINDGTTIAQFSIGAGGVLTPLSPYTAPTGVSPDGISMTPDGRFVYVTSQNGTYIYQYSVNQTTGQLEPLIPAFVTMPAGNSVSYFGPTIDATGTSAYVSSSSGATFQYDIDSVTGLLTYVATMNTTRVQLKSPVDNFFYGVSVSPATSVTQYDANSTGALGALSPASIATGHDANILAITSDGRFAFVSHLSSDLISYFARAS